MTQPAPTYESRRLCPDQPDGIPHLVDQPRAKRCDQHRAQRHRWSDANRYRKANNLPPAPWNPEPLTPERRREALHLFADRNAVAVTQTATQIRATIGRLRAVPVTMSPQARQYFDLGLARLEALTDALTDIAQGMGWPPASVAGRQRPSGNESDSEVPLPIASKREP